MLDCLEKEDTESTLSINNEGLLRYQANIRVATVAMKVGFTIQLEKEAELSDPLSRMEKKYQQLMERMNNIETKSDTRWESFRKRYERDQEKIEIKLQKKIEEKLQRRIDEIIPVLRSLIEEIRTMQMNIAQLGQEVQNMKSNEFHSLIQLSIRKIVREDDQSNRALSFQEFA